MDKMIRLNKYLQEAGVCSRREADALISEGRVTVDGRPAQLGEKIEAGGSAGGESHKAQRVCVDGREVVCGQQERILLAVNKPAGIVCTEDPREKDNIISFLNYPERVTYAGRLDKNSQGILLMTNDGYLIERMMRGRNAHEKEYEVRVDRDISDADLEKMRRGVPIEIEIRRKAGSGAKQKDGKPGSGMISRQETVVTRPCEISRTGKKTFRIVLTQGLNRQIRRMCGYCGYRVEKLERIRVMNILLGDLKPGQWRHVSEEEIRELERLLAGFGKQDFR